MTPQEFLNMLIYKSWHRGSKETDILLGNFARMEIHSLNDSELSIYGELIEEDDWDIYEWILSESANLPPKYSEIIKKIRDFNIKNCG